MGSGIDVLTFGESMGVLRARGLIRDGGPLDLSLGGAESNVAIGLARLGHGVRWCGRVGHDEFAELVLRTLRAEGVDARATRDEDRSTGIMFVEKRIADISRAAYYRRDSAGSALSPSDLHDELEDGVRVLHVTGITPALSESALAATMWILAAAKERGTMISFDINYRAALWGRQRASEILGPIARTADVVFASDDELGLVAAGTSSEGANALIEAGVGEVVIKRGGDGATVWDSAGAVSAPARQVPVVDTIGAGDAFVAGYLSALLDGHGTESRLDRGMVLGAFSVSGQGDWERLPNRAELELLDRPAGHTDR